jgi:hypothetical protein
MPAMAWMKLVPLVSCVDLLGLTQGFFLLGCIFLLEDTGKRGYHEISEIFRLNFINWPKILETVRFTKFSAYKLEIVEMA